MSTKIVSDGPAARGPGSRPTARLMSVPPPRCVPNRTSTGSSSWSVRSTTDVSKTTRLRLDGPDRGHHRGEDRGIHDRRRHRARLVDRDDHVAQRAIDRRAWPSSVSGDDRAVVGLVVAQVAADRPVPVDVARAAAGVSPRRGSGPRRPPGASGSASRRSMSSTTLRTTARAVSRVFGRHRPAERDRAVPRARGRAPRREQLRLEEHLAQVEPLEGVLLHDRHDAESGSTSRMSPSQRATDGADAPSPAWPVPVVERGRARSSRPTSSPVERRTPIPSASPPPSTRRQRRSRSSSVHGREIRLRRRRPRIRARIGHRTRPPGRRRGRSRRSPARVRPGGPSRAAASADPARDALARWHAAPGRRKVATVRRSSGSTGSNASPRQAGHPAVERREERRRRGAGSCRCRAGTPPPTRRRRRARRPARARAASGASPRRSSIAPSSSEQPAGPAGDEPVEAARSAQRAAVRRATSTRSSASSSSAMAPSTPSMASRTPRPRRRRATRAARQPDADPRDEAIDDRRDGRRVGAADVAVAHDAGERRQRRHQRRHVGADRRDVADAPDDLVDRLGEVGEQRRLDERGQRRQRRRPSRRRSTARRGRRLRRSCCRSGSSRRARPRTRAARRGSRARGTCRLLPSRPSGLPHGDVQERESVEQVAPRRGRSHRAGRGRATFAPGSGEAAGAASPGRGRPRAGRSARRAALAHRAADDQPLADDRAAATRTRTSGTRSDGLVQLVERRDRRGRASTRGFPPGAPPR